MGEWSYLLSRPEHQFDRASIDAAIRGRRILVTGAGGSIGTALSRRLADLGPERLVLLDAHEASLWRLRQRLEAEPSAVARRFVLADVRDAPKVADVLRRDPVDVVFHLAAYKHVFLAEENVDQAVGVNLVGTLNLIEAARRAGVETLVLPTTDKTVSPTSLYGCTKRVIERVARAWAREGGQPAARVARLVNVFGSQGSVVEVFTRLIQAGRPVTVTDLASDRYCITMDEAVHFLIAVAARPGPGVIYLLDPGDPIPTVELARALYRTLRPDGPSGPDVVITGLKLGERLHEQLWWADETLVATATPGLYGVETSGEDLPAADWLTELRGLRDCLYDWEPDALRRHLFELAAGERPRLTCGRPAAPAGEDR